MQMNPYQENYSTNSPLITNQSQQSYDQGPMKQHPQHYQPVSRDIRQSYIPNIQSDQFAEQLNPLLSKQGSKHLRSLFATILFFVGEGTILFLYLSGVVYFDTVAFIIIFFVIYASYLMLALCYNPLLSYLGNIEHGFKFQQQYNKIRTIKGYFSFHVECYHYQTRYDTRMTRDANGNSHTETYSTTQKVITHTATQQLHPIISQDDSGNVEQINALTQIVFIHNKVNYRFSDNQSRYKYDSCWLSFKNRHRRDVHQDYTQNFIIPGMKSRMTFYIGNQPKNYQCFLVLMSIFGMVWVYSMHIQKKVTRYNIQYMKILKM